MTSPLPLTTLTQRINSAAQTAGRHPDAVALMAVSKTRPPESIRPLLDQGQRLFGENKVQEAAEKWPALRQDYPDVQLHLIGPLQSNKVRQAIKIFDVIESLDRPKLARAIARINREENKNCRCLIQVNVGDEAQKAGINMDEADDFIRFCQHDLELSVDGLMAIPPVGENPVPYFKMLQDMARRAALPALSMGMSRDFEAAIACGSTCIRIGTALFGCRNP